MSSNSRVNDNSKLTESQNTQRIIDRIFEEDSALLRALKNL